LTSFITSSLLLVKEYQLAASPSQTHQQTSDTSSTSYSPPSLHTRKSKTRLRRTLRTVDIIVTKIAAVPPTVHPTVVVVTDRLAATVETTIEPPIDRKHVATSARKRIAVYGSIQKRNAIRLRKSTKAASATELKDGLTTALRNASSSMSPTTKETIVRRTSTRSSKPLL
jgi:hypothetical protein